MKKCLKTIIIVLTIFMVSGCTDIQHSTAESSAQSPTPLHTSAPAASPSPPASTPAPSPAASPFNDAYQSKYLHLVTVDEGCAIEDFSAVSGEEFDYAVYEIRTPEKEDEDGNVSYSDFYIYWVVVVLKDGNVLDVLRQERDEYAGPIPSAATLVLEADVNFDSANDILLWLGHFGSQGAIQYNCYLQTEQGFTVCPSFSEIPNPAVDEEGHVILSSWRNMAVSHSWAVLEYQNGEFVQTERLTEAPAEGVAHDEDILWAWKDEVKVNGEWQLREYFTENDFDKETLYQDKVYGENAYWDIDSDRWRTLFNNGKMSDFSIYSSKPVED